MLWLSWARVCASPQMSSHSAAEQSSYSMSLCKQWNRKCPGFRILGERKCRVWALWSASPYQKVEGIMMIICPVLWGKGGQRWNVLSANSDKQDWLISIQKSAFLCRGPAPAGSRGTLWMYGFSEWERERKKKRERDQTGMCSRVWRRFIFYHSFYTLSSTFLGGGER